MNLFESMSRRKSTRSYVMDPLSPELLTEIRDFAENLRPLHEDIHVEYSIVNEVKNIKPVRAPHYFLIFSEKKVGYKENIGFMFQQMDLFLSDRGLGSCWVGMAKPVGEADSDLEFVIAMAFGNPVESPYRDLSEFKRKSISEISEGNDERVEYARIAPSAVNSQNWFFLCDKGDIHCYQRIPNILSSHLYGKWNPLDMGIAICHIFVATDHVGKKFIFTSGTSPKDVKGCIYIGTVGSESDN